MPKTDWTIEAWARAAAHGLAYVQHTMDRGVAWGFRKMNDADEKAPPEGKHVYASRAVKIGRGALGLLGRTGRAYYERYDELKRAKR